MERGREAHSDRSPNHLPPQLVGPLPLSPGDQSSHDVVISEEDLSQHEWNQLTRMPSKSSLYQHDIYFRESLADARRMLTPGKPHVLACHATILVKPDAIVGGRVRALCSFLQEMGLEPIFWTPIPVGRLAARELWRYQWSAATLDRVALSDRLFAVCDSVFMLLRGEATHPAPASVRLSATKGSPLPQERSPHELRAVLDSPNRMLTFVHVADEPADVVRDIGVLFERLERMDIYGRMRFAPADSGLFVTLTQWAATVAERVGSAHFDVSRSVALAKDASASARARLQELLANARLGRRRDGDAVRLLEALDGCPACINTWDAVLIGAIYAAHEHQARPKLIDGSGEEGWTMQAPPQPVTRAPSRQNAAE